LLFHASSTFRNLQLLCRVLERPIPKHLRPPTADRHVAYGDAEIKPKLRETDGRFLEEERVDAGVLEIGKQEALR
jgi:hypothetical protein